MTTWLTWREAVARALYGDDGFYRRDGGGPAAHFRTSTHSPVFGKAVARLLVRVDEALGSPERLDFVDVGAGRGELIESVLAALCESELRGPARTVSTRLRITAVEVAERPEGLSADVVWTAEIPEGIHGLLIANEWLDNVIFDVAEVADDGTVRIVEVDPESGEERLGCAPSEKQATWLGRWWPLDGREPGTRAEIGIDRDAAWQQAVKHVERGLAVAIDYAHTIDSRPEFGTMTGYRAGQQVEPVPDGTCDVTAHVALDACATAASPPPDCAPELISQRDVIHSLGITGTRPPLSLAATDPIAYIRALSAASFAAELTEPSGLGGFTWLLQPIGAGFDVRVLG